MRCVRCRCLPQPPRMPLLAMGVGPLSLPRAAAPCRGAAPQPPASGLPRPHPPPRDRVEPALRQQRGGGASAEAHPPCNRLRAAAPRAAAPRTLCLSPWRASSRPAGTRRAVYHGEGAGAGAAVGRQGLHAGAPEPRAGRGARGARPPACPPAWFRRCLRTAPVRRCSSVPSGPPRLALLLTPAALPSHRLPAGAGRRRRQQGRAWRRWWRRRRRRWREPDQEGAGGDDAEDAGDAPWRHGHGRCVLLGCCRLLLAAAAGCCCRLLLAGCCWVLLAAAACWRAGCLLRAPGASHDKPRHTCASPSAALAPAPCPRLGTSTLPQAWHQHPAPGLAPAPCPRRHLPWQGLAHHLACSSRLPCGARRTAHPEPRAAAACPAPPRPMQATCPRWSASLKT
jgi:hypothetical protein